MSLLSQSSSNKQTSDSPIQKGTIQVDGKLFHYTLTPPNPADNLTMLEFGNKSLHKVRFQTTPTQVPLSNADSFLAAVLDITNQSMFNQIMDVLVQKFLDSDCDMFILGSVLQLNRNLCAVWMTSRGVSYNNSSFLFDGRLKSEKSFVSLHNPFRVLL